MPKRGAERQLTKDNEDNEEEEVERGKTWGRASADTLARRKIISVKRRGKKKAAPKNSFPTFNFFGGKQPAKKEEKKEENTEKKTAVAPKVNAFAALLGNNTWTCPACLLDNDEKNTQCAACEAPRPGKAKTAAPKADKTATPKVNSFAALLPKNSWQCQACYLDNKAELTACAACEAPRKPKAASTAATSSATTSSSSTGGFSFSFGSSASSTSSTSSTSTSSFSFGGSVAKTSTSSTKSAFGTSFSFGTGSSLSFGAVASSSSSAATSFGTGGSFDFSSSSSFGFSTSAPAKSKTSEMFKDAKAASTGLEKDVTIHKVRSKVYKFATINEEKKFVECGVGELHVNIVDDGKGNKKARMVIHADKTRRLVLASPIFQGMEHSIENDKFIRFYSQDLKGEFAIHMLRFKTKAGAAECDAAITKAMQRLA